MTPLEINLMLHCYYSPADDETRYSSAGRSGMQHLESNGLIEHNDGAWQATKRGQAYVEMLTRVPFPVAGWVNPDTKELIDYTSV